MLVLGVVLGLVGASPDTWETNVLSSADACEAVSGIDTSLVQASMRDVQKVLDMSDGEAAPLVAQYDPFNGTLSGVLVQKQVVIEHNSTANVFSDSDAEAATGSNQSANSTIVELQDELEQLYRTGTDVKAGADTVGKNKSLAESSSGGDTMQPVREFLADMGAEGSSSARTVSMMSGSPGILQHLQSVLRVFCPTQGWFQSHPVALIQRSGHEFVDLVNMRSATHGVLIMFLVMMLTMMMMTCLMFIDREWDDSPEEGMAGAPMKQIALSGDASAVTHLMQPQLSLVTKHKEIVPPGIGLGRQVGSATSPPPSAGLDVVFCLDLVVPQGCECILIIPVKPIRDGPFQVTDINGNVVLCVTQRVLAPLSSRMVDSTGESMKDLHTLAKERITEGSELLRCLVLSTVMGDVLAQCCAARPSMPSGSAEFHLMRASSDYFATLNRTRSPQDQFTLETIHNKRMHFWGSFEHHAVNITDHEGKLIATTENCNVNFDESGMYYRLRVAPLTDVALVLCSLLCIEHLGDEA